MYPVAIKITEQKKQVLVRRWKYEPLKKRTMPTTLYSVPSRLLPPMLPDDVIFEHNVDKEEMATYAEFFKNHQEQRERDTAAGALLMLTGLLRDAKTALIDPELKEKLTLNQYEELSESVNEIKKIISKNKNALARREREKERRKAAKAK